MSAQQVEGREVTAPRRFEPWAESFDAVGLRQLSNPARASADLHQSERRSPANSAFLSKMAGHLRGGPFRGGRFFGHGDLRLVILSLLDERPRHGYGIIKAIEDKSGGMYQPSAGTVYPTLTLLEEMGLARATPDEGGKRVCEITEAGRQHLAQNRSAVDDIFSRIARTGGRADH